MYEDGSRQTDITGWLTILKQFSSSKEKQDAFLTLMQSILDDEIEFEAPDCVAC